ncbi:MAG: transcriptional repressor [Deltaproteobacteria bacterium]|nr:transcriptional repressor [Deltaproteobacteria bacterium]
MGIRPTDARVRLLQELLGRKDHPSAAELIDAIRTQDEAPGVATLHQNLAKLVELQAIRRFVDSVGLFRFDACLDQHHHMVCAACGAVVDVPVSAKAREILEQGAMIAGERAGWDVRSMTLRFEGLCPACRDLEV